MSEECNSPRRPMAPIQNAARTPASSECSFRQKDSPRMMVLAAYNATTPRSERDENIYPGYDSGYGSSSSPEVSCLRRNPLCPYMFSLSRINGIGLAFFVNLQSVHGLFSDLKSVRDMRVIHHESGEGRLTFVQD